MVNFYGRRRSKSKLYSLRTICEHELWREKITLQKFIFFQLKKALFAGYYKTWSNLDFILENPKALWVFVEHFMIWQLNSPLKKYTYRGTHLVQTLTCKCCFSDKLWTLDKNMLFCSQKCFRWMWVKFRYSNFLVSVCTTIDT